MPMVRTISLTALALAASFGLSAGASAMNEAEVDETCRALGAEYGTLITLGNGETANLCQFEDNRACILEALQAGECAERGNHAMWATVAARYCTWLGGAVTELDDAPDAEYLYEIEGTCDLPDGSNCMIGRLYYGSCD